MSLQKPDPRQTVSFKTDDETLGDFDQWVENSGYDSRSEALRSLMAQASDSPADRGTPLVPPVEETLAEAYIRLVDVANRDGIVRDEFAKTVISSSLSITKEEVGPVVLRKLHDRNYLRRVCNIHGDTHWEIVGWDDE